MTGYMSGVLAILGINIIFAYSIYITAATGQLNLGGAGFQAIGAYASAILSNEMGFPIGLTLIFASIFGGLISFLIAFPILRTRGVYMVLATFAIAEIVAGVILNSDYLGGPTGIVVNDYIETELILIVAVVVVLFGFYLMPIPSIAHHAFSGVFDMNNLTELEGQITRLMWRNPHVQFTMLDANDELWDIETNSVSILSRMNVSSDLLAEGDRVTVAG